MMVQEEVEQETFIIIQVWALGPSHLWSAQLLLVQTIHSKQILSNSPWQVEFHVARSVLKCNFLFAAEMNLCQMKPQTSWVSNFFFFPKCIFAESQHLFFPSVSTMKKRLTTKNLKRTR